MDKKTKGILLLTSGVILLFVYLIIVMPRVIDYFYPTSGLFDFFMLFVMLITTIPLIGIGVNNIRDSRNNNAKDATDANQNETNYNVMTSSTPPSTNCGFLFTQHDNFNDKTTTTCSVRIQLPFSSVYGSGGLDLRHVSLPSGDFLLFDVYLQLREWAFIRRGHLIFNIDGVRNIKLDPHEQQSDVGTETNLSGQDHVRVYESAWYKVTKEELEAICNANKLSILLSGSKNDFEMNGGDIQNYCRLFYNQFYDHSQFTYTVSEYWPRIRRSANWNSVKEKTGFIISLLQGCSGMLLLLFCIGGGIIFGIVKLVSLIA